MAGSAAAAASSEVKGMPTRADMAAELTRIVAAREAAESAAAPAPAPEATPGVPTGTQPLGEHPSSLFHQALTEEAPKVEPDPEDLEPETGAGKGSKSTGYQRLRAQNAELQNSLKGFQKQLQELTGSVAPEIRNLREQNTYLQGQLQAIMQGTQPQQDPDDPIYQLQEKLAPRMQKELQPLFQQLQELKQRDAERERERKEERESIARQTKRGQYQADTQNALKDVLLHDAEVDDKDALATLQRVTTALALLDGGPAHEAARKIRRTMLTWAQGFEKTRGKAAREKMAAASKVPLPPPDSNTRADGEYKPTQEDLRKDGRFANYLKWQMAGSPTLRSKR